MGSIFGPFWEVFWGSEPSKSIKKTSHFVKWLLGEVWDAILDDFGTYLGAILEALGGLLEALESILGAVGGFGRGKEGERRGRRPQSPLPEALEINPSTHSLINVNHLTH